MKIHNFEQYSQEWWDIRLGKPSASCASKMITSIGNESKTLCDYAIELANDDYAGKSTNIFSGNKHTERGSELEGDARLSYQIETGNSVSEVGIIVDGDVCVSPDGLIDSGGTLEIKCLTGVHHTKALMYIEKNNKCPTTYYAQIQMQIMISGEDFGDLYLYHPDLPCKVFRVEKNNDFCDKLNMLIIKTNLEKKRILEFLNK